ncbi:putative serine/threonine-protein kinase PBL2 [Iris pallida]|uniref:Serine/threonine-protein kinase PBL2 n=1 Tax=Iris pallida TaxID=29817 RepID=A0AAX6I9V3_IRIPA|nr:putative serine/threonine-protein kinase PBL2 [Iris pallida]KAJ6849195.1 putative serine/threonine-protein kinase PBL2 [Iris pallida]
MGVLEAPPQVAQRVASLWSSRNWKGKLSGTDTTDSSKRTTTAVTSFRSEAPAFSLRAFTLTDLKVATKNFRSELFLGEGVFGCVFKEWIDEKTYAPTKPGFGAGVAIKKLKWESFQGQKEWLDDDVVNV